MQINSYLTEQDENNLDKLRPLARKNNKGKSKIAIISMALEIARICDERLDEKDFEELFNMKK